MSDPTPRVSTIRCDLIATYAAQAWIAVMGVAFIPLYVRYLGIESHGLIYLFANTIKVNSHYRHVEARARRMANTD